MDNIFRIFILSAIWIIFLIQNFARLLNIWYIKKDLPEEYKDIYDETKYSTSQQYLKETTLFTILISFFESQPTYHVESNGKSVLIKGGDRLASIEEIKKMMAFAEGLGDVLSKKES